jgi:hypothetical protein
MMSTMNIGSPVGAVVIDVPPDHGEQDCAEEQHHVSPLGLVGDGGRTYRLPSGTYLKLLKKDCEFRTQPDPLRYGILEDDWRQGVDALQQAKAEGLRSAAAMFEDRRQAGEPVTVARWKISRHGRIPRDSPLLTPSVWSFTRCPPTTPSSLQIASGRERIGRPAGEVPAPIQSEGLLRSSPE